MRWPIRENIIIEDLRGLSAEPRIQCVITFADREYDEDVVEHCEEDEDPVEDGGQLAAQQHGNGKAVASDANDADDDLNINKIWK